MTKSDMTRRTLLEWMGRSTVLGLFSPPVLVGAGGLRGFPG